MGSNEKTEKVGILSDAADEAWGQAQKCNVRFDAAAAKLAAEEGVLPNSKTYYQESQAKANSLMLKGGGYDVDACIEKISPDTNFFNLLLNPPSKS